MTNHTNLKNVISWCKENITIKNILRISVVVLMVSLFLACVTPTGYLFKIRYIDVALGCLGNIVICASWIALKAVWENEQREKEREEEEYERRRNRIRY